MERIRFSKAVYSAESPMDMPHNHEHFELCFLLSGKREIFIENRLFLAEKNTLIVFEPFIMHRTGGGNFSRISVAIPPAELTAEEWKTLSKITEFGAVALQETHVAVLRTLLEEGVAVQAMDDSRFDAQDALRHLAKLVIFYLSLDRHEPLTAHTEKSGASLTADVFRVTQYLEEHYAEPVTLMDICERFYLSKATLCAKFKKYMSCSVKEYLQEIRLKNAKQQLRTTDKSIEEIAVDCGFTSANYFRSIFKSSQGESPLKYRKSKHKPED